MAELTAEEREDDQRWLGWKRDDVARSLNERGWDHAEARAIVGAIPDEVFQIIRSQAVNELAECYITGMRTTIRIREALDYSRKMMPEATERSTAARKARHEALVRLSRPTSSPETKESD